MTYVLWQINNNNNNNLGLGVSDRAVEVAMLNVAQSFNQVTLSVPL